MFFLNVGSHEGVLTELSRHWSSEDFARAVEDAAKIGMVYSSTPKSLEQGCATTLVAALDPGIAQAGSNGGYFDDCQKGKTSAVTEDPAAVGKLWEVTEKLLGAKFM